MVHNKLEISPLIKTVLGVLYTPLIFNFMFFLEAYSLHSRLQQAVREYHPPERVLFNFMKMSFKASQKEDR
jgi:hypothetical protein